MRNEANADERSVSWKVLLPITEGIRILAVGLTPEEATGLARSYGSVNVTPGEQKYDIVVIGKEIRDAVAIDDYLSPLANDGTLVACSRFAQRSAKKRGLTCVGQYAGLPPKQPRVFIPLTSRKTREAGLSFHSPGSLPGKAWLNMTRFLNSAGFVAHLRHGSVTIWTSGKHSNMPSIQRWISRETGWDVGDMVIYAGSDSADRKITVLAMSPDCNRKIIVKIADTEPAVAAVNRESASLRILAQSSLAAAVPSVIAEDSFGPYFIQLQTFLNRGSGQYGTLSDAHMNFLSALSHINRESIPIHKTMEWLIISEAKGLPDAITRIASHIKNVRVANAEIDCHMIHGDFAPWNIITQGDSILVYDWENSNPSGFPFHDIFHFIYRQASLVGPWKGASAVVATMKNAAAHLVRASGVKCDVNIALSMWCIKEYLYKSNPKLLEIASLIDRIQCE